MQVLTKAGVRVLVSAVDADGLDIDIEDTPTWRVSGDFDLVVADDGMTATIKPKGPTSSGSVIVTSSGLTTVADISYTNTDPVERVPAKLNLTFTDLEDGVTTPNDPAAPGVPDGAIPGVPIAAVEPTRTVTGTGTAEGTGG